MLSGATSANILAMTFRQVVLEQLWNFELVIFSPGTQRDMKDLENPREVCPALSCRTLCNYICTHHHECNVIVMLFLQVSHDTDRLSSLMHLVSAGFCIIYSCHIR